MAYSGASYAVNGEPDHSVFIGNALVIVAFLGTFGTGFLSDPSHPSQPFVAILTSLLLAASVIGVTEVVNGETLRSRGRSTHCTVLDVDRQVHTYTYTESDGTTHTTTTVDYKHKLDCAAGRPDSMTLDKKQADKGDRIEVTYDPRGRLDPRPTKWLEKRSKWHTLAYTLPPVAIGLRLLVLIRAAVERRRRLARQGYVVVRREPGKR
ncbi:hypothetical protein [Streptomyces spirodelae]|uniref:DUF3592 domain-containing protein n=1 Tax=Streptomyces spirodelae TaxID=2812904 RepID=A0ABS3WZW0_9ACTN|nr:hypothetical protein [Streptomyces spirodelae]MBO8188675.1 hypothetical protein [Streptomyces spirodelae]